MSCGYSVGLTGFQCLIYHKIDDPWKLCHSYVHEGKRNSQWWLFGVHLVARNRTPKMYRVCLCFLAAFLTSKLTENFHLGKVVVDNSALWFSELFHNSHEARDWKLCLLCWVDTLLILSFPNTFRIELKELWFYN